MPRYMLCLLCFFLASSALAQPHVDNVRFEQQGEQVIVIYDLIGTESAYSVTVELSTDGGQTYTVTPKAVSGDAGDGVKPGRGKRIVLGGDAGREGPERGTLRVPGDGEPLEQRPG